VTTAGGAKCWGRGTEGQLGNGPAMSQLMPVNVQGLTSGVASISAGSYHTCAVTTAGGAKCWGSDTYGQLGNDSDLENKLTPVDVDGLTSGVLSISTNTYHTCAVTISGGAKCWGRNDYGQLGNDSTTNQPRPVDVKGLLSGVGSISAGNSHTCAVTISGGAKCWGVDSYGQLGNDIKLETKHTPVNVDGLTSGVVSISAGHYHTCVITTSGGAKCWGYNSHGQIGNNSTTNQPRPVDVQELLSGVGSISASFYQTCAVTTSGGAKCWGGDEYGQLGNDAKLENKHTPVDVDGLASGVVSIAVSYHTCAVITGGKAKCWGWNNYGQLGNDSTTNQPTPVDVQW